MRDIELLIGPLNLISEGTTGNPRHGVNARGTATDLDHADTEAPREPSPAVALVRARPDRPKTQKSRMCAVYMVSRRERRGLFRRLAARPGHNPRPRNGPYVTEPARGAWRFRAADGPHLATAMRRYRILFNASSSNGWRWRRRRGPF